MREKAVLVTCGACFRGNSHTHRPQGQLTMPQQCTNADTCDMKGHIAPRPVVGPNNPSQMGHPPTVGPQIVLPALMHHRPPFLGSLLVVVKTAVILWQ